MTRLEGGGRALYTCLTRAGYVLATLSIWLLANALWCVVRGGGAILRDANARRDTQAAAQALRPEAAIQKGTHAASQRVLPV